MKSKTNSKKEGFCVVVQYVGTGKETTVWFNRKNDAQQFIDDEIDRWGNRAWMVENKDVKLRFVSAYNKNERKN